MATARTANAVNMEPIEVMIGSSVRGARGHGVDALRPVWAASHHRVGWKLPLGKRHGELRPQRMACAG